MVGGGKGKRKGGGEEEAGDMHPSTEGR